MTLRDLAYRTLPGGATLGCGFIAKPDPAAVLCEFRRPHEYSVLLLLEGRGAYRDERGRSAALGPGDLVHRLPGVHHWTEPAADGGWREFFLLLPAPMAAALAAAGVALDPPVWHAGLDRRLVAGLTAFLPALRAADDGALPGLALAMAEWVGRAWRAHRDGAGAEDARLARARALLAADPAGALAPPAVAARLGMDYRSFRRWFAAAAGCPPAAYRLRARLDLARRLLATSAMPIPAVAAACGFADRFAFTRRFSAIAGESPARFRRRHG